MKLAFSNFVNFFSIISLYGLILTARGSHLYMATSYSCTALQPDHLFSEQMNLILYNKSTAEYNIDNIPVSIFTNDDKYFFMY